MINLKNSLILAATKLKTRKLRLAITVLISSLMFGILGAGIIAFTGFTNSIGNFSQVGLNDRFFVMVVNNGDLMQQVFNYISSDQAKSKAKLIAEEMATQRNKRAKELGLDFDKKAEIERLTNEGNIDINSELGARLVASFFKEHPELTPLIPSRQRVEQLAADYQPLNYFTINSLKTKSGFFTPADKNNQYPISLDNKQPIEEKSFKAFEGDDLQAIEQIDSLPDHIAQTYRLAKASTSLQANRIPILVPVDIAESLLNVKIDHQRSSAAELLKHRQELQQKAIGYTFKQCYRNNLAMEQLHQAQYHQQHKNDKDYQEPDLIYGLPTNNSCQIASILSDKRPAEIKKRQAAQDQFDIEFQNREVKPLAKELTFEIIGLLPQRYPSFGNSNLATTLIYTAIGSPGLGISIATSDLDQLKLNPDLQQIFEWGEPTNLSQVTGINRHYLEFADLASVKKFIKERDCYSNVFAPSRSPDQYVLETNDNEPTRCGMTAPFVIMPALNHRLQLDDAIQAFLRVILIALAITVSIAAIIMAGTVGRMIADSRRETAIFRAIGFKRLDIARVYGTYTFLVCLVIVAASLGLGLLGASILARHLDHQLTTQAILATNASDFNLKISLIGVSPAYLGLLVAAILAVGVLAIILPLIRNLRRNPIKDMRDE